VNQNIVEINSLRKNFGGVVAVDDLNLEVKQHNITAIIGPNGAGKTTIFNLVSGFIKPTRGEIKLQGRDITNKKPYDIAALGIARTFQNVQIFSDMTVLENVMVGRHVRSRAGFLVSFLVPPFARPEEKSIREKAMEWLSFVGLAEEAGKVAGSLPLGSQRILEIARGLAMDPGLILLDEPASGLNTRETLAMGDLIGRIMDKDTTVILVEHDMELVMDISDMVVVINFGKRIARGTPAEIQSNPEVIKAYLGE